MYALNFYTPILELTFQLWEIRTSFINLFNAFCVFMSEKWLESCISIFLQLILKFKPCTKCLADFYYLESENRYILKN